jgi:hypothetical protein
LESPFVGFELVFMGEDGVCVFAIVLESVDLGVGSFAGAECSVVGRIGVLLIITGLDLVLRFVVLTGVFFPSRTDAGRGLVFFTTGFTAGLAESVLFFDEFELLTLVTFVAGLLTVFLSVFDGAIDKPITGTATIATAATAAHFIQPLFMATPLPKPIKNARTLTFMGVGPQVGAALIVLHARPSADLSGRFTSDA